MDIIIVVYFTEHSGISFCFCRTELNYFVLWRMIYRVVITELLLPLDFCCLIGLLCIRRSIVHVPNAVAAFHYNTAVPFNK